jgi:hypothetical protein
LKIGLNYLQIKNDYYQLTEIQPTTVCKKDKITLEEHLNGEIKIYYLNYFPLPERPKKEIDIKPIALTTRKQTNWKPPFDHPWRKQFV